MTLLINALIITSLFGTLVISDTQISKLDVPEQVLNPSSNSAGYSVLKLLLEDEQYLTIIRRTKMIITFSTINDNSANLIDEISESSEQAIEKLDELAQQKPVILFKEFSDTSIAKATFDSLRMTTAKEFFFDGENFEKDLLLSQLKVLRLISHLSVQLEEVEANAKRKLWLNKLSQKYEGYYQQVTTRISLKTPL